MLKKLARKWLLNLNQQPGYMLAFALIIMALVSIMIVPLLDLMSSGLKQGTAMEFSTNRLYLADAGVEIACQNILKTNLPGWVDSNTSYSYSYPAVTNMNETGSRTNVTITYTYPQDFSSDGLLFHVVSTGTDANGGITTITAKVLHSQTQGGFVNAVGTLSNVSMSGGSKIIGDVSGNGSITMTWGPIITGDATASGTVTDPSGGVVGTTTVDAPEQPDPFAAAMDATVQDVYDETYTNVATPSPQGTPVANLTVSSSSHYTDPVYVTGNLSITASTASVVFDSQVYVGGNISFSGGTKTVIFSGPVYVGGQLTSDGGTNHITFNDSITAGSMNPGGDTYFTFSGAVKVLGNMTVGYGIGTSYGSTIYVGGNLSYIGAATIAINGNIYVKGRLILDNGAQIVGPDKVVVRGSGSSVSNPAVAIGGGSSLYSDTSNIPFIIVPTGSTTPALSPATDPTSVTLTNGGYASALIYAPTAAMTVSGAGYLYGAVFADTTTLSGSGTIEYALGINLRTDLPGSSSGVGIETWEIN